MKRYHEGHSQNVSTVGTASLKSHWSLDTAAVHGRMAWYFQIFGGWGISTRGHSQIPMPGLGGSLQSRRVVDTTAVDGRMAW